MFLEDASSLDGGFTFSTICQGYLRRAKQKRSHAHADSGRGPNPGSGVGTLFSKVTVSINTMTHFCHRSATL